MGLDLVHVSSFGESKCAHVDFDSDVSCTLVHTSKKGYLSWVFQRISTELSFDSLMALFGWDESCMC